MISEQPQEAYIKPQGVCQKIFFDTPPVVIEKAVRREKIKSYNLVMRGVRFDPETCLS